MISILSEKQNMVNVHMDKLKGNGYMKKLLLVVVMSSVFNNMAMAAHASEPKPQLDALQKQIQTVQSSMPGMLASLESSIQAQIKATQSQLEKTITAVQAQVAALQASTDEKIEATSQDASKQIKTSNTNWQSAVSALQAQLATLQTDTNKKLEQLNKSIAGAKSN